MTTKSKSKKSAPIVTGENGRLGYGDLILSFIGALSLNVASSGSKLLPSEEASRVTERGRLYFEKGTSRLDLIFSGLLKRPYGETA